MSDLGPDGLVWPHRVLEWMQEAAAFASAEAGYPPERYRRMGAAWFVREILFSIEGTCDYGESLEVHTWVSDLRRFRSRREYRVFAANRVIAVGQADWFLLAFFEKPPRLRPLRPDDEMKAVFPVLQEHAVPPGRVFDWSAVEAVGENACAERVVRPLEIDHNGHVNHVHYLAWFEDHALTLKENPLVSVRLFYENDARREEQVALSCRRVDGGTYHEVRRGEARLARAIVRRG